VQQVLHNLLELQSLDQRLSVVRARLAAIPKKAAEVDARVTGARGEVEKSKAAQIGAIKDRKKYELDVEQWKEKVHKYKDQMYQVKTNEAYKALQHEAQLGEAEISKAEDRLLEQMVAAEEYDRRIKSSEKALKEVEEFARSERSKIETDKTTAEEERGKLEVERSKIVAGIPEAMLDHYDRIVRKHGGIALAEVRDEKCTACGMRIRPHVFQEMRRANSEEIFHCETCTRILYYVEPAPAASQASAAATQSGDTPTSRA
jgi:uncharacterized protein